MDKPSWFLIKARQAWWAVTDILILVWFCRAPVAAIAAGGLLIALTDQARDIVIATTSHKEAGWPIPLFVTLWAIMGWYWARTTLEFARGASLERRPPKDGKAFLGRWAWRWRRFVRDHLPRAIGALAFCSVAAAFWRAHNVYALYGDDETARRYLVPAISYAVLAVVFYGIVWWRKEIALFLLRGTGLRRLAPVLVPHRRPLRSFWEIDRFARWVLIVSVAASPVFFFLFAVWPVGTATRIGSAVSVVLLGLSLAVALPSLLVIIAMRTRLPVLGVALLAFFVMPWLAGDHHDSRSCRTAATPACVAGDYIERRFLKEVFLDWHQRNLALSVPLEGRDGEAVHAPPLIVVATAGGASRAAYFTAQVLGEIAKREEDFSDRLFLVSGVSGGSLGAAVFLSLVEADRRATGGKGSPRLATAPGDGERFIDNDFLAPAFGVGFYVDAPFSPFTFVRKLWAPIDRAAALEMAWEAAWLDSGIAQPGPRFSWSDGLVRTFAKDSDRPWPILALNGTSVEKGKRIIASNVLFTLAKDENGVRRLSGFGDISGGINRYDALEILQSDIPISTAVTMSARFPIVSPSGGLRNARGELVTRVVDGGLFENFGAVLADEVLRYLVERIDEARDSERLVTPIAILISSDPSLDRIHLRSGPGAAVANPDCLPASELPVEHPGNGWPECPAAAADHATLLADPLLALYDGRVARGELAATALRDRIVETRITVRERLDREVQSSDAVSARLGYDRNVDFFHFRQCRVEGVKGPTMSWHDSPTAWKAMRAMLGLDGTTDPCGNRAEFFRLCERIERLSGKSRTEPLATQACADKGWPTPVK